MRTPGATEVTVSAATVRPAVDRTASTQRGGSVVFVLLVAGMLVQQQIGDRSAARQRELAQNMQLAAVEREFEVTLLEALVRIVGVPVAAVPQHHGAAAILALRDGAFEIAIIERMFLHFDRQPLVVRIERRTSRYRP